MPRSRQKRSKPMPRAICLLFAAILLLAQGEARAADPVPIRIGYVVTPPELQPVLFARPEVTKHLGQSYTMEPVHFKSTPVMITALAAGELDIAALTFASFGTAIVNAHMEDLRIIADEFQDGVEGYFTEPYLVRRDSGIDKIEDLKGKVIATNGIGSGVDMAMRAMLRRHGLDDKRDYSVVEVQFPNMKAVLMDRTQAVSRQEPRRGGGFPRRRLAGAALVSGPGQPCGGGRHYCRVHPPAGGAVRRLVP